ncbi:MAG: polyhydroxyalkanoate synthesis regulator DNA-binding domain-containing protein [Acidobacteriota bacterium]
MIRVIKRYESRKLYDTEESRYVSLEDISTWVREGQEVKVVDNSTHADVTAQTLTQIILEEGRKGTAFLPSELLHDLVRLGEKAFSNGVEQVQSRVDRIVRAGVDRLGPVRRVREEMDHLRLRLESLETTLGDLEEQRVEEPSPSASKKTSSSSRKPATRRKATAKSDEFGTAEGADSGAKKKAPARRTTRGSRTKVASEGAASESAASKVN